jgi:uncharacterized membrane protein
MSENPPQNPFEPTPGGPTPPNPAGPTPPSNPPQPPAYGAPGQPPAYGRPGGPYGTQPSAPFAVGEALGFAWDRFKANWLFWVLFVLLTFVVSAIFSGPSAGDYQERMREASDSDGTFAFATGLGLGVGSSTLALVGNLIVAVLQALGINAALREVSGERATWGTLFKVNSYGMVILTALLLLAAGIVGLLTCGLGLIALAIFAPFTYHNVVDRGMSAWPAFTSSFSLVGKNFGAVFLLELALLGLIIAGAILCGLGLFIALPLSFLALAFAFRRLTGGPVAPGPLTA